MAIEIPRELIEYILLGSGDSRRRIQDSPILIDVWFEYAKKPNAPVDLLITSHQESTSTELAAEIYRGIARPDGAEHDPGIAALQNFVAAEVVLRRGAQAPGPTDRLVAGPEDTSRVRPLRQRWF